MTSLWSQRSTNVPAIGLSSRFGSVAAKNTRPVASAEPGRDRDHGDQRELVEPVAEQRDELAGPQRRERAVEREADVRVLADALDGLDAAGAGSSMTGGARDASAGRRRPASKVCQRRRRRGPAPALPMTSGRSSATAPVRAGDRPVSAPGSPGRSGRLGAPATASRSRMAASCASSSSCGTRTTAANRKNARPRVRNASPTDATFWMIGNGIGMTSASGPRWSRKLASSGGGRMSGCAEVTSAGVRPAAMRVGSQIGM